MTTPPLMKRRAILAFVQNRPGVLNKMTMLIRRKMYNAETVTACKTHLRPGISRVTEVISAKELDIDQSFWREVAIVKTEADASQIESLERKFNFEILDRQNHGLFIIQVSGTEKKIDDFLHELGREKIIEVARSGFTAIEK